MKLLLLFSLLLAPILPAKASAFYYDTYPIDPETQERLNEISSDIDFSQERSLYENIHLIKHLFELADEKVRLEKCNSCGLAKFHNASYSLLLCDTLHGQFREIFDQTVKPKIKNRYVLRYLSDHDTMNNVTVNNVRAMHRLIFVSYWSKEAHSNERILNTILSDEYFYLPPSDNW